MPGHDRTFARFDAGSLPPSDDVRVIGSGSIGAKASGLAMIKDRIAADVAPQFAPAIRIDVPALSVIASSFFDRMLRDHRTIDAVAPGRTDPEILQAFERAVLPAELRDALAGLAARAGVPLAVRSSSLLEDRVDEPFAGVYATEMLAGSGSEEERRTELEAAVARVFASTFLGRARSYRRATGHSDADERMAVIVQDVVGSRMDARYYPQISGVARSCNFYPAGLAEPADGVVELALGLGKTIVEEAIAWPFSPAAPHANPPYNGPRDLVERTQKTFWAIDLSRGAGRPGHAATGGVKRYDVSEAERDGALRLVASTYLPDDDRIVPGTTRPGPRVIDFGPILKSGALPLTAVVRAVLKACADAMGTPVEIEFAVSWGDPGGIPARFALLQLRPMWVAYPEVDVDVGELDRPDLLAASTCALGNGAFKSVRDIVYVKPASFASRHVPRVVESLDGLNRGLAGAGRPYVLIGFGRWGSTDPTAGIPVDFGQISGANTIVETTLPGMHTILSQGSHFFHNITSARALYFSVTHLERHGVDWAWLDGLEAQVDTGLVRHVRLAQPLDIRVDGRTRRGVIRKPWPGPSRDGSPVAGRPGHSSSCGRVRESKY